jgi:hypothetical protein
VNKLVKQYRVFQLFKKTYKPYVKAFFVCCLMNSRQYFRVIWPQEHFGVAQYNANMLIGQSAFVTHAQGLGEFIGPVFQFAYGIEYLLPGFRGNSPVTAVEYIRYHAAGYTGAAGYLILGYFGF